MYINEEKWINIIYNRVLILSELGSRIVDFLYVIYVLNIFYNKEIFHSFKKNKK